MQRNRLCVVAVSAVLGASSAACDRAPPTRLTDSIDATASGNCAAIMQEVPGSPIVITTERLPDYVSGLPGTTDGEGTVLITKTGHFAGTTLDFYSPNGTLKRSLHEHNLAPLEQLSGFAGVQNNLLYPPARFRVFRLSTDGELQYEPFQDGSVLHAPDPSGGFMLLTDSSELHSYDETAQLRWSRALTVPATGGRSLAVALGVDLKGNTLVLFDGTQTFEAQVLGGMWIDSSGLAGPLFRAAANVASWNELNLVTSVTDGLFLQLVRYAPQGFDAKWLAQYASLTTTPQAPPEWLAARPLSRIHPLQGGNGYALFGRASTSCSIEVLTPKGASCGEVDFAQDGRGCQSIAIGLDGTVITQPLMKREDDCFFADGSCSWIWKWWPGYFK